MDNEAEMGKDVVWLDKTARHLHFHSMTSELLKAVLEMENQEELYYNNTIIIR